MNRLPLGPLTIDVAGLTLTEEEKMRLSHPLVGGVILFGRNYENPAQLAALCAQIHALREPRLPIGIDHEGGRVQRCRKGFTRLPAMRRLGDAWEQNPAHAKEMARSVGYILASELRACGVDFSFTPVLDLDWERSGVIGDRAFHRDPAVVVQLANALIEGLRAAGMISCGKHFPGHGWAEADSHVAIPVDERTLDELQTDILPYRELSLDAVMPAHVIYPAFDEHPCGFSKRWNAYLRNEIKFSGLIFSDDLSMEGASVAGDIVARASAAYAAGCDVLLVCNAPDSVTQVLSQWTVSEQAEAERARRRLRLLSEVAVPNLDALRLSEAYVACRATASSLLA